MYLDSDGVLSLTEPGGINVICEISDGGTLWDGVIVSQLIGFKVLPEVAAYYFLAVYPYYSTVITLQTEFNLQVG